MTDQSNDLATMVEVEGQTISLADLAGIDTSQIADKRGFEIWPAGIFQFEAAGGQLGVINKKMVVKMSMNCVAVHSLLDDKDQPAKYVGKTYTETFFITQLTDIGRVTAFMKDTGYTNAGQLQAILSAWQKVQFTVPVKNRPNKDDPDKVYANLDLADSKGNTKVKPVGQTLQAAPVAAAAG